MLTRQNTMSVARSTVSSGRSACLSASQAVLPDGSDSLAPALAAVQRRRPAPLCTGLWTSSAGADVGELRHRSAEGSRRRCTQGMCALRRGVVLIHRVHRQEPGVDPLVKLAASPYPAA